MSFINQMSIFVYSPNNHQSVWDTQVCLVGFSCCSSPSKSGPALEEGDISFERISQCKPRDNSCFCRNYYCLKSIAIQILDKFLTQVNHPVNVVFCLVSIFCFRGILPVTRLFRKQTVMWL
jgi:hypothetical protein